MRARGLRGVHLSFDRFSSSVQVSYESNQPSPPFVAPAPTIARKISSLNFPPFPPIFHPFHLDGEEKERKEEKKKLVFRVWEQPVFRSPREEREASIRNWSRIGGKTGN